MSSQHQTCPVTFAVVQNIHWGVRTYVYHFVMLSSKDGIFMSHILCVCSEMSIFTHRTKHTEWYFQEGGHWY